MISELEEIFEGFLEKHMREYEIAETALFSIVRTAFIAGWNAAGGKPRYEESSQDIVKLMEEYRSRENGENN